MDFNNYYFEDEIRDGFYIPGMVKRSWGAQMTVLDVVDRICKKHNLKWFADYGTLIGAVRHEGFIPWDDDLDICMLRGDYEKLKTYLSKELPKGYEYLCFENEPEYSNFLIRVTNSHSINLGNEFLAENCGFPYTAGIDIFAMDYLYSDENKEEERSGIIKKIWDITEDVAAGRNTLSTKVLSKQIEEICGYCLNPGLSALSALRRVLEKIFSECESNDSNMVAYMPRYYKNVKRKLPLSYYQNSVELPFEEGTICVPALYEDIMTSIYGKWEIGKKTGGAHNYPFFKEQQAILEKNGKKVPYLFSFELPSEEDKALRSEHEKNCDSTSAIVSTLEMVLPAIFASIANGDYPTAGELLENSQKLSIQLGNMLESQYKNCAETVGALEKYCEIIFNLYNDLAEGQSLELVAVQREFEEYIGNIKDTYRDLCDNSGDVLIVIARSSEWKYVKKIYKKYDNDPNYNVYVMAAPYALRDNCGNAGEYVCETIGLDENINVVAYDAYPFATKHPSKIFITNPFDEYKSAMTLHSFFYATNLYKYCRELVYVQNFEIFEFADEKSYENAKSYVLTPGVAYSDKIVVPSEFMKNVYCKVLEENAAKEKIAWSEKFEVLVPFEEMAANDDVKTLLFYISISDILKGGEKVFIKLEECIDVFRKSTNALRVYWYADESLLKSLEGINVSLSARLNGIIKDFEKTDSFKVIGRSQREEALAKADGYFGSGGYLFNSCFNRNIPIMHRNKSLWNVS